MRRCQSRRLQSDPAEVQPGGAAVVGEHVVLAGGHVPWVGL